MCMTRGLLNIPLSGFALREKKQKQNKQTKKQTKNNFTPKQDFFLNTFGEIEECQNYS